MINTILHSIAKILYDKFKYKVHIDDVEQGFETPCFYLKCIDFSRYRLLTNSRTLKHYKNKLTFVVTYFPKFEEDVFREDFNEKIVVLLDTLDNIKTENFNLRLGDSSVNIVDKTLILTINYKLHTLLQNAEYEKMLNLFKSERKR